MGSIGANYGQYQSMKYGARAESSKGATQRAAAYKQATNLEEEARADSVLAGENMMRQRENQTAANASARASRSSSGLSEQGSGQQAEIAIADIFETAISDMALSNAISDSNKQYRANMSRFQGDLGTQAAEVNAAQMRETGKNALGAAYLQTATTAMGGAAGIGAMNAYHLGDMAAGNIPGSTQSQEKSSGNKGSAIMADYLSKLFS